MNLEQKLVRDLANNEHIIHVLPYDECKLEYEETKGHLKTTANIASPIKDSNYAVRLLKEFGYKNNQIVMKRSYGGKEYIIFKGHPGNRQIIKGTRYLKDNPKIVRMVIGPKGVAKSIKCGFVITFVLCAGVEIFDYIINDIVTLSNLLGIITSDQIQIGISSFAAAVAGIAAGSIAVIGSSVAAPFIIAIGVGICTTWALGKIDKNLGVTKALIESYRKAGVKLSEIEYSVEKWYNFLENNPVALKQVFGAFGRVRIPFGNGY